MFFPADAALPDFVEPVLDYLSDKLPPPLYAVLVKVLSHTFAAITSLATICSTFLTNHPQDWDVQRLLPPILTLVVAYLALASLYRTTTWLIRLTFWFMKWGTLLGIFFGGVGYFLGNGGGNGVGNYGGGGQGIGGLFATLLEDPRRPAKSRTSKTRPSKNKGKKPSAWDTFDRHRDWKNQGEQDDIVTDDPVQKVLSAITNTAGNVLGGNWWEVAKGLAGAGDAGGTTSDKKAGNHGAKSKEKAKAGKARAR
ncbi:hypothetical protein D9619_001377 [Psilocybe cf. subviscida]|uniref:Uncharacterized protein n=1 Tax=Psilocybe cf. subviscida TaxID=2480587 RepID=A0A8H5BF88_9AGAR|nr:hypothetical protein D9619_001377 [Psilocybe cf. subviscida]